MVEDLDITMHGVVWRCAWNSEKTCVLYAAFRRNESCMYNWRYECCNNNYPYRTLSTTLSSYKDMLCFSHSISVIRHCIALSYDLDSHRSFWLFSNFENKRRFRLCLHDLCRIYNRHNKVISLSFVRYFCNNKCS